MLEILVELLSRNHRYETILQDVESLAIDEHFSEMLFALFLRYISLIGIPHLEEELKDPDYDTIQMRSIFLYLYNSHQ